VIEQLSFPFIGEPEPATSPRPSRYRRTLARIARQAYALGLRRRARAEAVAGELMRQMEPPSPQIAGQNRKRASALPPIIPFHPSREDRHELLILASRVARLTISRRDPEAFFIERSEISNELRRISSRGELQRCKMRG